jgi:hypothetical protein
LFLFNTIYFFVGIGFLLLAAFLYLNPSHINDLIKADYGKQYLQLIYTLLILSTFLTFVGFVGCSGILTEKSWLLFMYFTLLFLIFGFQFFVAVYLYIRSVDYFRDFSGKLVYSIRNLYGSSATHTRAIDYIQFSFQCCGWHSPKDWLNSTYVNPSYSAGDAKSVPQLITKSSLNLIIASKIPYSCCVSNFDQTCIMMNKFHEIGCETIIKSYYNQIEIYVAWTMAFLNIFQLVLLVLSLYLLCILFFERNSPSSKSSDIYGNEEQDNDRLYITSYYL